ncbi:MAG: hypothetical protein JWO38_5304 [Gemmataceae bacterium]|nr:hypothetical protein [Gemmataceae bacterium]
MSPARRRVPRPNVSAASGFSCPVGSSLATRTKHLGTCTKPAGAMPRVLFWNAQRKSLDGHILQLASAERPDILVLIEFPAASRVVADLTRDGWTRATSPDRFGMFSRVGFGLSPAPNPLGDDWVGFWRATFPCGEDWLIVVLHGSDRRNAPTTTPARSCSDGSRTTSGIWSDRPGTAGRSFSGTSTRVRSSRRLWARAGSMRSASGGSASGTQERSGGLDSLISSTT